MKSNDFFTTIIGDLAGKHLLPDIVDYALPNDAIEIDTPEFEIFARLDYGHSEGIYLDLFVRFESEGGKSVDEKIGTIKTLSDDAEAMRVMGTLYGDLMVSTRDYLSSHWDDFNKRGYCIKPFKGDEEAHWSYPNIDRDSLDEKVNYCLRGDSRATEGVTKVRIVNNKIGKAVVIDKSQYPVSRLCQLL